MIALSSFTIIIEADVDQNGLWWVNFVLVSRRHSRQCTTNNEDHIANAQVPDYKASIIVLYCETFKQHGPFSTQCTKGKAVSLFLFPFSGVQTKKPAKISHFPCILTENPFLRHTMPGLFFGRVSEETRRFKNFLSLSMVFVPTVLPSNTCPHLFSKTWINCLNFYS
jgi:hypothetical protein